jgi:hypothetical protein
MQMVCHPEKILHYSMIHIAVLFFGGGRVISERNSEWKESHPFCAGVPLTAPETCMQIRVPPPNGGLL